MAEVLVRAGFLQLGWGGGHWCQPCGVHVRHPCSSRGSWLADVQEHAQPQASSLALVVSRYVLLC